MSYLNFDEEVFKGILEQGSVHLIFMVDDCTQECNEKKLQHCYSMAITLHLPPVTLTRAL